MTMWSMDTIWFEVSLVTFVHLMGVIFLGHFEERSPQWRKVLKYFVMLAFIIGLSQWFGRTVALVVFGLAFVPVLYIHLVILPKHGVNGWTGEPREKYYEFRGWNKESLKHKEVR